MKIIVPSFNCDIYKETMKNEEKEAITTGMNSMSLHPGGFNWNITFVRRLAVDMEHGILRRYRRCTKLCGEV